MLDLGPIKYNLDNHGGLTLPQARKLVAEVERLQAAVAAEYDRCLKLAMFMPVQTRYDYNAQIAMRTAITQAIYDRRTTTDSESAGKE